MLKQPHQLSKIWNHTWKHSPQHTTFSGHPISTETRYLSYDTVISLHFLMCFSSPSHKGKSNHPCVPKLRWLPVGSSFWCQNHSFKTTIIISWKLLGHLHCPPPSSRHSTGSRSLLQWGPGILCPAILQIGFPNFFPGGSYNQRQKRERESSKHATWKRPSQKDTTNLKVALWVL